MPTALSKLQSPDVGAVDVQCDGTSQLVARFALQAASQSPPDICQTYDEISPQARSVFVPTGEVSSNGSAMTILPNVQQVGCFATSGRVA
jgi:hypothetical protein